MTGGWLAVEWSSGLQRSGTASADPGILLSLNSWLPDRMHHNQRKVLQENSQIMLVVNCSAAYFKIYGMGTDSHVILQLAYLKHVPHTHTTQTVTL